ncbi:MAG TPA: hypothetical protein PL126_04865 [Candidatus Cloacimonadota bacterium]|nr:hypothetical protein [Candidatus Cloacimonadota bacterium]
MHSPHQLSVSNDVFDKAVKATAIVKKQRIRSVQERLHDLTSLKLVPKQWNKGSSSGAQNDDREKIKPIPVKIIEFKVADIMRAMRCDNEFEFWGRVLSVLHRDTFECHEDLFITENRGMVLEQLERIEERIIRIDYSKEIPAIDDVLGVFFPCSRKDFTPILEPWIELYPQVIAYFSFVLGVSAQNLATVTGGR